MAMHAKGRLGYQCSGPQKNLQSVPSIELPEQLTHLLAVVIHLTLLVGSLHLWRSGTCLIQPAQAI